MIVGLVVVYVVYVGFVFRVWQPCLSYEAVDIEGFLSAVVAHEDAAVSALVDFGLALAPLAGEASGVNGAVFGDAVVGVVFDGARSGWQFYLVDHGRRLSFIGFVCKRSEIAPPFFVVPK